MTEKITTSAFGRALSLWTAFVAATFVSCASQDPKPGEIFGPLRPSIDLSFCARMRYSPPFPASRIIYENADGSFVKDGQDIPRGAPIRVLPRTPRFSSPAARRLYEQGLRLYSAGNFPEAAKILRSLLSLENDNPFALNMYARTLYRLRGGRNASYRVYRRLLFLLEQRVRYSLAPDELKPIIVLRNKNYAGPPKALRINLWFLEAYWKMGTLLMDRREYAEAELQIRKMLGSVSAKNILRHIRNRRLAEQALSYLTEAAYFQKNRRANRFYFCETLKINPANRYVFRFLLP